MYNKKPRIYEEPRARMTPDESKRVRHYEDPHERQRTYQSSEPVKRIRQSVDDLKSVALNLKYHVEDDMLHADVWHEVFLSFNIPYMIEDKPLWLYARLMGNINVYAYDLYRRCALFSDESHRYKRLAQVIQLGYSPAVTLDRVHISHIPFDPEVHNRALYDFAMQISQD